MISYFSSVEVYVGRWVRPCLSIWTVVWCRRVLFYHWTGSHFLRSRKLWYSTSTKSRSLVTCFWKVVFHLWCGCYSLDQSLIAVTGSSTVVHMEVLAWNAPSGSKARPKLLVLWASQSSWTLMSTLQTDYPVFCILFIHGFQEIVVGETRLTSSWCEFLSLSWHLSTSKTWLKVWYYWITSFSLQPKLAEPCQTVPSDTRFYGGLRMAK